MTTLQDKLDNIYQTKLEIKSAIGTDSDVFSEYPAMIRSMAGGGVSYSYLDERLSYYVETSDLESMGYATESYVTNAIENIPGVDLSSYVSYSYLADSLSSYVTYTYLESKEYITINDVPSVDLSSYVTYTYLESKEYATESYVNNAISNIPGVDLSSYVTYTYLESKEYITINDVPSVDLSSYVTYTYLESKEYATESYVNNAISNIPGVDLSSYVTYTYLEDYVYTYTYNLPTISQVNAMFSYDTTTGTLTITTIS